MAAGNLLIESYVPAVKFNKGTKTKLPVVLSGTAASLAVGGSLTVTGTSTFTTQSINGPVLSALVGATVVLTAAQSGTVFINRSTSGSPSWTLPTAAVGLYYHFLVSSTSAGFTVTGGTIFAKANPNGASVTGTTLTNTQGTAVVGDYILLWCDGTSWRALGQLGVFAAA